MNAAPPRPAWPAAPARPQPKNEDLYRKCLELLAPIENRRMRQSLTGNQGCQGAGAELRQDRRKSGAPGATQRMALAWLANNPGATRLELAEGIDRSEAYAEEILFGLHQRGAVIRVRHAANSAYRYSVTHDAKRPLPDRIMDLLTDCPNMTSREVAMTLNVDPSAAEKKLLTLVRKGKLTRQRKRRGRPYRYEVTE